MVRVFEALGIGFFAAIASFVFLHSPLVLFGSWALYTALYLLAFYRNASTSLFDSIFSMPTLQAFALTFGVTIIAIAGTILQGIEVRGEVALIALVSAVLLLTPLFISAFDPNVY